MDKIDLEELERLAAQATPGPWRVRSGSNYAWIEPIDFPHSPLVARAWTCQGDAEYITAACNAVPELIARVRELERERELYRERLHESWNQTEYCIDLLHDAGVNLTMWACGVESCQQCDVPECDMGDLDMVEKYTSRKAIGQATKEAGK